MKSLLDEKKQKKKININYSGRRYAAKPSVPQPALRPWRSCGPTLRVLRCGSIAKGAGRVGCGSRAFGDQRRTAKETTARQATTAAARCCGVAGRRRAYPVSTVLRRIRRTIRQIGPYSKNFS
jgi:hypothetical protein